MRDIKQRLLSACNGHPHAKIPWPHRLLHEAVEYIEQLEAERDGYAQNAAFYRSCALSGEAPKPGAEPFSHPNRRASRCKNT